MANQFAHQKQWAKIVAKAWVDEDFKAQLLSNTNQILEQEEIELPEGVTFKCLEATDSVQWLILPSKPVGAIEADEERLAAFTSFLGSK